MPASEENQPAPDIDHAAAPGERPLAERILAQRMLRTLRAGSDVRRNKVRRLRAAIRAMAYENPLKVEVALDRLSSDLRPPDPTPPVRTT